MYLGVENDEVQIIAYYFNWNNVFNRRKQHFNVFLKFFLRTVKKKLF
jgi:hypothetical protein